MLIALVIFVILFSIRRYLYINILGFTLYDLAFSAFIVVFFIWQTIGATRAYKGNTITDDISVSSLSEKNIRENGFSEEEKIQIIVSFIPLIGIFVAEKNPMAETLLGRKVGNFFLFLLIASIVLLGSTLTIIGSILLLAYTILFATTAVYLFAENTFFTFKFYRFIPTYHEFEAKIAAGISYGIEFFRIAFGKNKEKDFASEYQDFYAKYSAKIPPETPFWTHPALIGIPIINIITFPAFFQKKYHAYQGNIAEGFLLTVFSVVAFIWGTNYGWLYMLVFSIATLITESKTNTNIRAPIVSIARNIFIFAYKTKKQINTLQENTVEETIQYNTIDKVSGIISPENSMPQKDENTKA